MGHPSSSLVPHPIIRQLSGWQPRDDNRLLRLTDMRILLLLLAISRFAAADETSVLASQCNYAGLVKCFINILDEWAWTLYELKDNVVTIQPEQCDQLRELEKCIKDELPEQHKCTHSEIVEVSNTVSDLLTHRKDSGSFLRSYYLLQYSCSEDGQKILSKHRTCLKTEKIGEMTLSAGTYLSEKFLEHEDSKVCENVNTKLQEYIKAMDGICSKNEAAQLMCQSLKDMFTGMHAEKVGPMQEDNTLADSSDAETVQQASEHDALRPADAAASSLSTWNLPLIAMLLPLLR
ncbi:unnamed protein product [Caenorhabditis auriculariae]|uniref:Uncharacterized protein n=1 Tax=Caenorhabditis auriculariae TaxID=2777116 RepID=A0A8S1H622_9PELO|nr:unnamed protein product [Caenorhabditis auriculariae]